MAEGPEQQRQVGELGDTGSKLVHDVLLAWTRDNVFLYDAAGTKIPVLLEDQTDADGKARAINIADGKFLLDDKHAELRFAPNDLTSVDTDAALRGVIQITLDTLALADANPDARENAVLKLGNSKKLKNIPVLQARLGKETDPAVIRAINEAIAMLQLGDTDSKVQITALQQLATLKSSAAWTWLKHLWKIRRRCPKSSPRQKERWARLTPTSPP